MGLPTVLKACGGPCCPVEASAPGRPCLGLGVEPSTLGIFVGTADKAQSAGAPHLELHPLDPVSPRELAGSAALDRP